MRMTPFHARIIEPARTMANPINGYRSTTFEVKNSFISQRVNHRRDPAGWETKNLISENLYRSMIISVAWSITYTTGWTATCTEFNGPTTTMPLSFEVRDPGGFVTLAPKAPAYSQQGVEYRVQKEDGGYYMEVSFADNLVVGFQEVDLEACHAMDVGIFITEWIEESRRRGTANFPGVELTNYAAEGQHKEEGSFRWTSPHLSSSSDPNSYRLKVPVFLPQHIEARVKKREMINSRKEDAEKEWLTLHGRTRPI